MHLILALFVRPAPRTSKKTKGAEPYGLIPNWQKAAPSQPTPLRKQQSARAPSDGGSLGDDEDAPAFEYGGIPSDDEEVERAALTLDTKAGNTRHRVSFLYDSP